MGSPGGASGTEPTCQCRRHRRRRFGPGSGRPPRGHHNNPLQYSCLEKPTDRGAWWATVHGVAESAKTERLNTHTHTHNLELKNMQEKNSVKPGPTPARAPCINVCSNPCTDLQLCLVSTLLLGGGSEHFPLTTSQRPAAPESKEPAAGQRGPATRLD